MVIFIPPSHITSFFFTLGQAGGATQEPDTAGNGGGSGGFTATLLQTLNNPSFSIMVGQGGYSGAYLNNGGGGAGGGLVGIFSNLYRTGAILETDRARAVAIAGGGGGESDNNNEFGGAGGGTTGNGGAGGITSGGGQAAPGGPVSPSAATFRGADCQPPLSFPSLTPTGGTMVSQYGFGGRSWANAVEVYIIYYLLSVFILLPKLRRLFVH